MLAKPQKFGYTWICFESKKTGENGINYSIRRTIFSVWFDAMENKTAEKNHWTEWKHI